MADKNNTEVLGIFVSDGFEFSLHHPDFKSYAFKIVLVKCACVAAFWHMEFTTLPIQCLTFCMPMHISADQFEITFYKERSVTKMTLKE